MESWTVTAMWIAVPTFFVFVLFLAASPKDTRNLGEGRGGTSPLGAFSQTMGQGILNAQAVVEPDKRHLADVMRQDAVEEDDEGGPKDPRADPDKG